MQASSPQLQSSQQQQPVHLEESNANDGSKASTNIKASKLGVICFEKMELKKTDNADDSLIGSLAITIDKNHKGWLHILIFIGQLFSAILGGKKRHNINLCHSQVIIGVNSSEKRKGDLLLAHAIFGGIKTTSESHKKDDVITGIYVYRPVDDKLRTLFEKFAKQTAVNFGEAKLNPKDNEFKSRVKERSVNFQSRR